MVRSDRLRNICRADFVLPTERPEIVVCKSPIQMMKSTNKMVVSTIIMVKSTILRLAENQSILYGCFIHEQ